MSTPTRVDDPRAPTLRRTPRDQMFAGLLLTLGPILATFGLIWGLAWLIAERTPLARTPEWVAWGVGTATAAFFVFGVPLGLLMWGFRKYKG